MANTAFGRRIRRVVAGAVAAGALAAVPVVAHADTVASLLGNFTINQYSGLRIADDSVSVRYTVVFGQLPALRELHAADADRDGVTSQSERDTYVGRLAPAFADEMKLTVDGAAIPLKALRWTTSLPTEQGGFSLRLDVDFEGSLPPSAANGDHALLFANGNYPGRFGWQEIVVQAAPSWKVFATDAFSTSLTADLTEALAAMPASGPLSERAVHLTFAHGAPPPGTVLLGPRPGAPPEQAGVTPQSSGTSGNTWLARATRRLVDLISGPSVAPSVAVLAILAAVLLGALHAFAPGHGKTIVGAYLIGSRATLRHAVFLGTTVTITHTLGVFALGFATLFASRYIVPERLFPVLSLISGLLVLGMGIVLLAKRWAGARDVLRARPTARSALRAPRGAVTSYRLLTDAAQDGKPARGFVMAYAGADAERAGHDHPRDHVHRHQHPASHSHDGGATHSHGGRMHSHLPRVAAGESVTWRSLLALGISGGLVPCPSAMVLLLAAIALNKTAYGLALVLAFSVGLALTLIAVGLVFLYARNRIRGPVANWRFARLLPVLSAGFITLVGALLCYGAVTGVQF